MASPAVTVEAVTVPPTLLRRALLLDAITTSGNGLLYLLASGPISELLGVRSAPLLAVGAFLTTYGIVVAVTAKPARPAAWATRMVIGTNIGWTLISVVTAASGWLETNPIGMAWTVAQGFVVAGFAALQWIGLKRT
ncbi:hypothetical protein [Amycolatopsis sp. cmx-11-12]|uniref:hypothetical protein n=1 Tax=Amycolatopsis sp. cmx-11-12 TaxID=2785795 RepID=UPI0039182763